MQSLRQKVGNLGLWPRMAMGFSLGFLILFAAFFALSEEALRDNTDRILNERLVIAQMAAGQFDGLFKVVASELEQASLDADFDPSGADLSAEARVLSQVYSRLNLYVSEIVFMDTSGRVILSQPTRRQSQEKDMSDYPFVVSAFEKRELAISDAFIDQTTGKPVTAVTFPVYQESNFLGLLSGLVDLSGVAVSDFLEQASALGRTGHAVLLDHEGRVLYSTFELPFLSQGEHASFYEDAVSQGQAIVESVPFELASNPDRKDGEVHVMAFAPLELAPWAVAVGVDAGETYAAIGRLRVQLTLLAVLTLAGVLGATLIGSRQLVRPVERLTHAAQRIAEGDLDTPLQAKEGGEIGAMATALELMRKLLLSNIEKLADLNETLEGRVAERTLELRQQQTLTQQLLRRAITAQEEERARISQELHDEIGQTLTAVQLGLDGLTKSWPSKDKSGRELLHRLQTLTEHTLADLRRIITALRPGVLDQLGLVPALGWVADHTLRPLGLKVAIDANGLQERLPVEIETILFRIAQEAMSNVARHSQANHLGLHLQIQDGEVSMKLTDDGKGFDVDSFTGISDQNRGLGLAGMQERASLAGGQVAISSVPGESTTVHVRVPLPDVIGERTLLKNNLPD